MKITAEFNSTEELMSFIKTFGGAEVSEQYVLAADPEKEKEGLPVVEAPKAEIQKDEDSKDKNPKVDEPKKDTKKFTKELVRDVCAKAMKKGKQAEVKQIIADHGASKLPELKEEEYEAVITEVEAL